MLLLRSLLALLAAVAAVLACAVPAQGAEITRKKAMWGPLVVDNKPTMPTYAELGVGIVQYRLNWARIAKTRPANPRDPSDPAYDWPEPVDYALRTAEPFGIELLLNVSQTPEWANGGFPPFRAPKRARDYADFMEAASRRYPEVRHWAIWNEPNRTTGYFAPPRGRLSQDKYVARHYSTLVDKAYASLKKVSRSNLVIGGSSYDAASSGAAPDFQGARKWIRNLKLANGKPPRMDMYGHNPFSSRGPDLKQRPRSRWGLDFADTDDLIKEVNKRLRRSKRKKMKVFLSEYALQTERDSGIFPNFYVTRETQAAWLREALAIVRANKNIYSFGYFKLYDELPNSEPNSEPLWGLITRSGERKPGFFAWRDG